MKNKKKFVVNYFLLEGQFHLLPIIDLFSFKGTGTNGYIKGKSMYGIEFKWLNLYFTFQYWISKQEKINIPFIH